MFSASDVTSRVDLQFPDRNYSYKLSIITELSKSLPSWAYIYLAPKVVFIDGKNITTQPMVINAGEVMLFEKP